jgi:hypothetical protein
MSPTNPETMRQLHDDFKHCAACELPSSCRAALKCAHVKRKTTCEPTLADRIESNIATIEDRQLAAQIIRTHAPGAT